VIEGNTVFEMLATFHPDAREVEQLKDDYAANRVGDGDCKKELGRVLNAFLDPIRQRRETISDDDVLDVLREGNRRANETAERTLADAKAAMHYDFGPRTLGIGEPGSR
jgi:tryptophanyl-tRNA synthetase